MLTTPPTLPRSPCILCLSYKYNIVFLCTRIIVTHQHWQVLDDGSFLHINKTTIADTDEDGNSFFFHRAVIHNIAPEAEDEEAAEVDDVVDNVFDAEDDESVPQLPYEDEDTGVDAGLLDI